MAQPVPGWADRQMPACDEVFLDHIGYFTADLDAAGAQLTRLGFKVSAVNVQTNDVGGELQPSGTSNRLVRLRRGYLEVLAATHDTPLAAQLRAGLARYAGLHLIALSHDDPAAVRARLVADGFAMQPLVRLRRRDRTLAGAPEVAWTVLRPEPGAMPEGRVQFAKSHNPDRVWQADQAVHANAADALTDMLLCVDDPVAVAERYGRYAGREPSRNGAFCIVTLDRGRLLFAAPAELAAILGLEPPAVPWMAGQALRTADLAATRAALAAAGIAPLSADAALLLVAPADALGSGMLFHAASIADPWTAIARRS